MKIRNRDLICLIMLVIVIISGCASKENIYQNKNAEIEEVNDVTSGDEESDSTETKKKSDYELSRVKYYDAVGTCILAIFWEYNEAGKEIHKKQINYGKYGTTFESYYTYPDNRTMVETHFDQVTDNHDQVDTTVYNEAGDIQSITSTNYIGNNISREITNQVEYTYDQQGNLILKESFSVSGSGELSLSNKTEYTYDTVGNCITEISILYSKWQDNRITKDVEYLYDTKNNKTKEISHIADEHTDSPIVYEYNKDNQVIKESDYTSLEPTVLKKYFIFEYDDNGNRKKYTCYSPDHQVLSYAEYEYIKIGTPQSNDISETKTEQVYRTWNVDGTANATIRFESTDSYTTMASTKCEIKNYDIYNQKEVEGNYTSASVKIIDKTMEINIGPDEYVNFTFWFDDEDTLKMKDLSSGNTISLKAK